MTLSDAIMTALRNASSQMPMSFGALQESVAEIAGLVMPDEFADHLESLCDAAQVRAIRGQRGGIWQNLYWSVSPTAPINATKEDTMSEQKNTLLARLIVLHGPIAGAALAEKARETGANIPAKNVPGLLETLVRKGEVIAKKYMSATWYMTPNQADEWEQERPYTGSESAGHVMSVPEADQGEAMPEADPVLMASANRMLVEKLEHREQDIEKMRTLLASKTEAIVQLEDQIEAMKQSPGIGGRLALLLIDSADLTEVEELDSNCDPRIAIAAAMARIDHGHAARAVVVRIIGEAQRRVEWKAAA